MKTIDKLKFISLGVLITALLASISLNVYLYKLTPYGANLNPIIMEDNYGKNN